MADSSSGQQDSTGEIFYFNTTLNWWKKFDKNSDNNLDTTPQTIIEGTEQLRIDDLENEGGLFYCFFFIILRLQFHDLGQNGAVTSENEAQQSGQPFLSHTSKVF